MKQAYLIGSPVEHSLSPLIHNAGYKALNIAGQFTFKAIEILPENFSREFPLLLQPETAGISVTLPHKIRVIEFLDTLSDAAKAIGAVNTVYFDQDQAFWTGENTDYLGILNPLKDKIVKDQNKVAILGARGAGRAAVYACKQLACEVDVFNRTFSKAEDLARDLNVSAKELNADQSLADYDIIINATSLGLEEGDPSPCSLRDLHAGQIVFDCIYNRTTKLLDAAEKSGALVISGLEMFVEQARGQFKLYTGLDISGDVFIKVINEK